MAKKQRLIPFHLMPASWGLKGAEYDRAESYYYYEGFELDRKIAKINYIHDEVALGKRLLQIDLAEGLLTARQHDSRVLALTGENTPEAELFLDLTHGIIDQRTYDEAKAILSTPDHSEEREVALLDVKLAHGEMDDYQHAIALADLYFSDEIEKKIAFLDADLQFGVITEQAHAKEVATLREEPWVGVVDHTFDLDEGVNGFSLQLDWNENWITFLRLNGYIGMTDEQVVDQWFSDVCRSSGAETFEEALGGVIPFISTRRPAV